MRKTKKIFAVTILLALALIFGLTARSEVVDELPEDDPPCPWGYKSTTAWQGQCISCFCDTWNYTGKYTCPRN